MISDIKHLFVCFLAIYVFFGETSVQVLCPFVFRLFGVFVLTELSIELLLKCLYIAYLFTCKCPVFPVNFKFLGGEK